MLRIFQAVLVLGIWIAAGTAAGQTMSGEFDAEANTDVNADDNAASDDIRAELDALRAEIEVLKQQSKAQGTAVTKDAAPEAAADDSNNGSRLSMKVGDWETGFGGYFRAPLTMGISRRTSPDDMDGAEETQVSYGPNRLADTNYYSFAYTRLQEQDWVQLSFYARKKHVDAEIGWMGYWLQSVGFRNPDASWAPGIARLTLDTDIKMGSITPNIALTAGAWWPKFGYHKKYDTFTLGQYRQLGEQLQLTIPFNSGFKLTLFQGFGSGRDGYYNFTAAAATPIYGAVTSLNLMHYEHIRFEYRDYIKVGLHFSKQWSRDPMKYPQGEGSDMVFSKVRDAELKVVGGEVDLHVPRAGHLWVSPSYIGVKHGWSLANTGTEVMHSLGGAGIAGNYLGYQTSLDHSTGTGKMINLGFVYENALSEVLGRNRGEMVPDLSISVFGLMALASLDLPEDSMVSQDKINQLKWGADAEVQILNWLGFMLRYDSVNYDLDNAGYIFSAITSRLSFSSDFLSGERIFLQYAHYIYGDNMTIAGNWPWGQPLVAGSDITQNIRAYNGKKPDENVITIQAEITF